MIKIENVEAYGWEATIRGARNPMNSWEKMDSGWDWIPEQPPMTPEDDGWEYVIGPNDHKLLQNLTNAGPDHGKFMRMLTVTLDITAPLYWWKEFDTYKVGTVANSCSTMHKIHAKPFCLDDFSHEHLSNDKNAGLGVLLTVIDALNLNREIFLSSKDKSFWWNMIQLLPTSYNQRRTVMLNYQVLKTMYHARKHHKLDEWREFCRWIETLPHSELITGGNTDA